MCADLLTCVVAQRFDIAPLRDMFDDDVVSPSGRSDVASFAARPSGRQRGAWRFRRGTR